MTDLRRVSQRPSPGTMWDHKRHGCRYRIIETPGVLVVRYGDLSERVVCAARIPDDGVVHVILIDHLEPAR